MGTTAKDIPAVGTPVTVSCRDAQGRLCEHDAVVLETFASALIVRFAETPDLAAGAVSLRYTGSGGAHVALKDLVARWNHDSEQREMVFHIVKRDSLRVAVSAQAFTAEVGEHADCPVTDLSFGGIGVKLPREPEVDSLVSVRMNTGGGVQSGDFRVRHTCALSCGRYKCGLELVEDRTEFIAWLRAQVMRIQRSRLQHQVDVASGAPNGTISDEEKDAYINMRVSHDLLVDRSLPFSMVDEHGATVCEAASAPDENTLKDLHDKLLTIVEVVDIERAMGASEDDEEMTYKDDAKPVGPEKRAHVRTEYRSKAAVQLLSQEDRRLLNVETLNISRGGLSFRSTTMVYEGTPLMLLLNPEKRSPWILARVAYCEKTSDGYRVGVCFTQSSIQKWEAPPPDELVDLIRSLGNALDSNVTRRVRTGASRDVAGVTAAAAAVPVRRAVLRWGREQRELMGEAIGLVIRALRPDPALALAR